MYYWWITDWTGTWYRDRVARRHAPTPAMAAAELTGDQRLTDAVAQRLLSEPSVTGGRIDLSVQCGVVILDGEVDTDRTRAVAGLLAESVPGVRDVCNVLTVTDKSYGGS